MHWAHRDLLVAILTSFRFHLVILIEVIVEVEYEILFVVVRELIPHFFTLNRSHGVNISEVAVFIVVLIALVKGDVDWRVVRNAFEFVAELTGGQGFVMFIG